MPKVDSMTMLMPKVVVMYDHDEFLPDVMLCNTNLVFMYDHRLPIEYLPDVMSIYMFININMIFMYDHEKQYEYMPDVM